MDKVERLHELHQSGCFVIPNPWDAGSAKVLEQLGFKALATTSSGFAWSIGRRDNHVTLEDALAHFRAIASAVDVPVSADFEHGFAADPDGVAANVAKALETGIAGLSIEDSTKDDANPLFEFELAVRRMHAARRAIDASGTRAVLTGRSEGFIAGRPDLEETIRRLKAYADAGADCLFAPGIRDLRDIERVVQAVAPKPVNVIGGDYATFDELRAIGVRRISVGSGLARTAWTGFLAAAKEIAENGTFTGLGRAISGNELNMRFVR
ncbi:MAG: 2-methylisocitrate lyase [Acidobacteria bacterium]|nr:MAG: 2-methylisocitrate lyase [Acidobacteriota bacterium]